MSHGAFSKAVGCVLVLLLPMLATASTGWVVGTVNRTLSDSLNFGGCMAQLSVPPVSAGLDCKGNWVTFSCTGELGPRDAANRSFETAQIALVSRANVAVLVNDAKKHNGYCFATRIDLFPPPDAR
jgi:hypothetical protein